MRWRSSLSVKDVGRNISRNSRWESAGARRPLRIRPFNTSPSRFPPTTTSGDGNLPTPAMVAPAALTLGSPCAAGPASHGDRPCYPKLASLRSHSGCLPRANGRALRLSCNRPLLSSLSAPLRAVAVDSDQLGSSPPSDEGKPRRYYFLVANAKFMLDEEEHFQEQLSERLRYFGERNREQDFWLVIEPRFLDKFPSITRRLKRPAVALVSTDGTWITFMKLRLDRVLTESFEADSVQEALASNPVDLKFDKPKKWTAPYPKYESGWWERFLPPGSSQPEA